MKFHQLTSEQRYTISVLLQKEMSKKAIAEAIGVHRSTVYREIERNSSEYTGKYTYTVAVRRARRRKRRYQRPRKMTPEMWRNISKRLKMGWSAQQICGRMKTLGRKCVSHTTIYKYIWRDLNAGGDIYRYCRFHFKYRNHWLKRDKKILSGNRKSIDERPACADGKRFGDWEMDLIIGPGNSSALTMVERSTNLGIIRKLAKYKTAREVSKAVTEALRPIKDAVHTITTDNGPEFMQYEDIEKSLGCSVYYAHPHCPWQKGAVENLNMLIRQYIDKRCNINKLSTQYIAAIEAKLNDRPRKKLNFRTPKFVFYKKLK